MSRKITYPAVLTYALVLLVVLLLGYTLFGHQLVQQQYEGRSLPLLGTVISGQANHPLGYYLQLADLLANRVLVGGVAVVCFVLLLAWISHTSRRKGVDIPAAVGWVGLFGSVLLLPPIYQRLFGFDFLRHPFVAQLCFAIALSSLSLWLIRSSSERRFKFAAILCGLLVLLGCELAFRFVVGFHAPTRILLAQLGAYTRAEYLGYRGHAFLHYAGTPSNQWAPDVALQLEARFNSLGFIGSEFRYPKPSDTVRIACLGGSTTQAGYPEMLQKILNTSTNETEADSPTYEVLNFGLSGWTSAHSLVNFVLNVRDFAPDLVVIHHGWNDMELATLSAANFRGDLSHLVGPFDPPLLRDWYVLRASALYRYVRNAYSPIRYDHPLAAATNRRSEDHKLYETGYRESGINPFVRNLRSIIDLARVDGATVVFATMPHSTRPEFDPGDSAAKVAKSNALARQLCQEMMPSVRLVDLDQMMTGSMDHLFFDFGHVTEEGDRFKASKIAEAILTTGGEDH